MPVIHVCETQLMVRALLGFGKGSLAALLLVSGALWFPVQQASAQPAVGALALPRPNDLNSVETMTIVDPEPRGFGLLGCTMRMLDDGVAGDSTRLMAGRAFKVLEFTRDDAGDWSVTNVIEAPEKCGNPGNFGTKFDVDGEFLAVLPMDMTEHAGVHVYRRGKDGWEYSQNLLHRSLSEGTRFHGRIVMEDGLLCIYDREGVVIYRRNAKGIYGLDSILNAEEEENRDRFGRSVAIEGDTIAVSLFRSNNGGEEVRIFKQAKPGGSWALQQTLKPSDGMPGSWFGESMILEPDELVIASPKWDIVVGKVDSYRPDADGNWALVQELKVKPDSLSSFGTTMHLGSEYLVVGASMPKVPGSAYVFKKGDDGAYTRICMLGRPEGQINDAFAMQVTLVDDEVLVSAPFEKVGETGRAGALRFYALERDAEEAPITASSEG